MVCICKLVTRVNLSSQTMQSEFMTKRARL
jgi:hypothetical protein